jgi:hypothetical protein
MLSELLEESGGVLRLHAFPLCPDDIVLGAVSVYQNGERQLGVSPDDAQLLAKPLGVAPVGHLDADSVGPELWGVLDQIDQATGMVVAQLLVAPVRPGQP